MLIAHAPAGYIVNRTFNKARNQNVSFLKFGLIFSLWPDLDLIYFYFFDRKATFHHLYFTHLPFVLLICLLLVIPFKNSKVFKTIKNYYYLFLINWVVHLVLDTFTGGIAWLYPLSNKVLTLFVVPAVYSHWIISFILHWTFIIEIIIVFIAFSLALRKSFRSK
jgi:inner membrane protein